MAKQHRFTTVSLWIGGKEVPITNSARLRYRLEYSAKEHEDAVSNDYNHVFDLEMTCLRMVELCKNSVTIKWQNDRVRKVANFSKKYPRDHIVKYEDVFPGKASGPIMLSDAQIKAKAKDDPEYRKQLLEQLLAMDED